MGEERHAFGTSLFCVSRRLFVLFFCVVMAVLCYVHIFGWIFDAWPWFYLLRTGTEKTDKVLGCVGPQCYEVFSCYGMKDASQNMREPLTTLAGALFFPLGAIGAHLGIRNYLQILGLYVAGSACLHIGLIIWDAVFLSSCNMYSTNMVMQVLLQSYRLPPSMISLAARQQLLALQSDPYQIQLVDSITGGFKTTAWYFSAASVWAVILAYVAYQVHALKDIMERGPLGLGVHYGLGQWDELLDHDSIRRHQEKKMASKFIDDARLPFEQDVEKRASGYLAQPGGPFYYGSCGPEAETTRPWPEEMQEPVEPEDAAPAMMAVATAYPGVAQYGGKPLEGSSFVDERDSPQVQEYDSYQAPVFGDLATPPEVQPDEQGSLFYEYDAEELPPQLPQFGDERSPSATGGPFSIGGSSAQGYSPGANNQ
jgi:hypothetical protein